MELLSIVKCLFGAINLLLLVSGVTLGCYSFTLIQNLSDISVFFYEATSYEISSASMIKYCQIAIILGLILFVVMALIGFYGCVKESIPYLIIFAVFVMLLIIGHISLITFVDGVANKILNAVQQIMHEKWKSVLNEVECWCNDRNNLNAESEQNHFVMPNSFCNFISSDYSKFISERKPDVLRYLGRQFKLFGFFKSKIDFIFYVNYGILFVEFAALLLSITLILNLRS